MAPRDGIGSSDRHPIALIATISVCYQRIRPVLSHGNVLPFVLPLETGTGASARRGIGVSVDQPAPRLGS